MPRHARLDAPGTLHHVILRGMEQGKIAHDRADRAEFVRRLERSQQQQRWLSMPGHCCRTMPTC